MMPKTALTGTYTLTYMGNGGKMDATYARPSFNVDFVGEMPENSGAAIKLGAEVFSYTDGNGIEYSGHLLIPPGDKIPGDTHVRAMTFLKANLLWDTTVECVAHPPLWDKYNYMVYKIETKNTSTSIDSTVDYLNYTLSMSAAALNEKRNGVKQEDLMTWYADGTKNNDFTTGNNGTFVGKPDEGGALIYNTTGWTDAQYGALDTETFSNVGDLGLGGKEIPYQTAGQDGLLTFLVPEDGGGHLTPNPEGTEGNQDTCTLILAVPYTTNFDYSTDSSGNKKYTLTKLTTTSTVFFGNRGEDDYSWAKVDDRADEFQEAKNGMQYRKAAWDFDSHTWTEAPDIAKDRLGYLSSYRIDGIETTGNVAVVGTDLDAPYGAVLADDLPENYELTNLSFRLPHAAYPADQSDLGSWMCLDDAQGVHAAQFEVKEADGSLTWVDMGAPSKLDPSPETGFDVWQLGGDTPQDGISVQLEAQGIGARPGHQAQFERTFTGNVRFLFADKLPRATAVPVDIFVKGVMRSPSSDGVDGMYVNAVQSSYGLKNWIDGAMQGQGNYYMSDARQGDTVRAALSPIKPVAPTISSLAHYTNPAGQTVTGSQQIVPLGEEASGWRFSLKNVSPSKIEPSEFSTDALPVTLDNQRKLVGFETSRVTLSKDLLAHARLSSVDLYAYRAPAPGSNTPTEDLCTLSAADLSSYKDETTGNIVIPRSAWGGGYFSRIVVHLASFDGLAPAAGQDAYVDLFGTPTVAQKLTAKGTFATAYEKDNLSSSAQATLDVQAVKPNIAARAYYTDPTGHTSSSPTTQNAPLAEESSGWRFDVSNASISKMQPASFSTSSLPARKNAAGNLVGFETTRVTLSKDFLAHASVDSVDFFLADSQTTKTASAKPTGLAKGGSQLGPVAPVNLTWAELAPYVNADTGALDIPRSAWGGGYLSRLEVHLDSFDGQAPAAGEQTFVDIFGKPTDVATLSLQGTFSTAYGGAFPDLSAHAGSSLRITTIDPTLSATYGWKNAQGVGQTGPVPYRWGDGLGEDAWFRYTLGNKSSSAADDVNLDFTVGDVSELDGSMRGFIATDLEIPGFEQTTPATPGSRAGPEPATDPDSGSTSGPHRHPAVSEHASGIIGGIDLFDATQTVTGDPALDPAPRVTLPMEQLQGHIDASGTLKLDLTGIAGLTSVKTVRIRYAHLNGDLTSQSGKQLTATVHGKVDTHGRQTGAHAFDNKTSAQAHFYPTTDAVGDGVNRSATAAMPIDQYRPSVSALAFKPAAVLPATPDDVVASRVSVANRAEGVGYNFTVNNATQSRSDKNDVVLSLDSVGNKAGDLDAPSIHGFKTKSIVFDAGLLALGQDAPGQTSFAKVGFYFASPLDGSISSSPDVELSVDQLNDASAGYLQPDGSYRLDMTQGAFEPYAGRYLKRAVLSYGTIDPAAADRVLNVQMRGMSDWFNNAANTEFISATVQSRQTGEADRDTAFSAAARGDLSVPRPGLDIHTHAQYVDLAETSSYVSSNSDGNRTFLSVPYDRDFQLWAQLQNSQNASRIDEADAAVNLPLRREGGIAQEDGSVLSAWTGFHTTKVSVSSELMGRFSQVGTIELYGGPPTTRSRCPRRRAWCSCPTTPSIPRSSPMPTARFLRWTIRETWR